MTPPDKTVRHRHGVHCSDRIREIENELADVRREFEEAGHDYMRDVQAREREVVRLKHLLRDNGIDWNPPEAYRG